MDFSSALLSTSDTVCTASGEGEGLPAGHDVTPTEE